MEQCIARPTGGISWTKLKSLKLYDQGDLDRQAIALVDEAARMTEALMAESIRAFVDSALSDRCSAPQVWSSHHSDAGGPAQLTDR